MSKFNIDDSLEEIVAKRIALANNGGDWAEHYNEDQKNVWRERAKEIINLVVKEFIGKREE